MEDRQSKTRRVVGSAESQLGPRPRQPTPISAPPEPRSTCHPSARMTPALSDDLESLAGADLVDHEQIGALAGELGLAVGQRVVGLGREPDDDLGQPCPGGTAPSSARTSGLRVSSSAAGSAPACSASDFLILDAEMVTGRKSATAAAITTASAPAAASITAVRSSSADSTRTTLAPAGSGSATLAEISVTSAPRAAAVSRARSPADQNCDYRGSAPDRALHGCRPPK